MKAPRLLLVLIIATFGWQLLPAQELSQLYGSGSEAGTNHVTLLSNCSSGLDFYYLDGQGMVQNSIGSSYLGLPNWKEGLVLAPGHAYAGARTNGDSPLVLPFYFPTDPNPIDPNAFIPLETDPPDDHQFDLGNLDLIYSKVAFSATKLYYSLKCNSMSYPVSSGLTFYSYLGILTQPGVDPGSNPIVYGLMNTVTAPGVIAPGLYKITGTGMSDLVLIGEIGIDVDTVEGVLTLSCDLADLLSDPDFSAWYNPAYPLVATQAMTSRITLSSGNQVADTTAGVDLLLKPWPINFSNDHPPQLHEPLFSWQDGLLSLQVNYADADQNPAQNPQVSIDGADFHPLFPVNLIDFEGDVLFAATAIPCPQNWQIASFSVINGGVATTISFPNPDVDVSDELNDSPMLSLSPNPVRDVVWIKGKSGQALDVYNLKGQLMKHHVPEMKNTEFDLCGWPAGIYIVKQGKTIKRLVKI